MKKSSKWFRGVTRVPRLRIQSLLGLLLTTWAASHAATAAPEQVTGESGSATRDANQAEAVVNVSRRLFSVIETVAYNGHVPSPLIQYTSNNRIVYPGASLSGWSYRSRSASNPNPPFTHALLPPPSGIDALWGDPSLASNSGSPDYVFMGALAIPHAKFDFVANGRGTPGQLEGVMDSTRNSSGDFVPSPLGGGCVARSTDGGQNFSVIGCVSDTSDTGSSGDDLGHFFDGSSMAVAEDSGGGYSAYISFIDTQTSREAAYRMADITDNSSNPFQPDNTLMGSSGPLVPLGKIQTHVRLLAAGSDVWKLSLGTGSNGRQISNSGRTNFYQAILKTNLRGRNGNAIGLASDAVAAESLDMSPGQPIGLRTGPQFAYDIGVNESGRAEMRFVYIAADSTPQSTTGPGRGSNFHLQGGYCELSTTSTTIDCNSVAQWKTPSTSDAADLFPAIAFGTAPGTGTPIWKVTFQHVNPANSAELAIFSADLVRPDLKPSSSSFTNSGLVIRSATPYQTPCPDLRGWRPGASRSPAGYWGDYDGMVFDSDRRVFIRAYSDSSQGCPSQQDFNSQHVHVSTIEIPAVTFGSASPPATGVLCPQTLLAGDRDFDGHGPMINVQVNTIVSTDRRSLKVNIAFDAKETQSDFSEVRDNFELPTFYTAPAGKHIGTIISGSYSTITALSAAAGPEFGLCNDGDVISNPNISGDDLVSSVELIGDTGDGDISNDGDCHCDTQIRSMHFNAIEFSLEND